MKKHILHIILDIAILINVYSYISYLPATIISSFVFVLDILKEVLQMYKESDKVR